MGMSLNQNQAQKDQQSAAEIAMGILKDRFYDSMTAEMGNIVAEVAREKHDGDMFSGPLTSAVDNSKYMSSVDTNGSMVSFPVKVEFQTEQQQEMWDVATIGNLRTLWDGHSHTHARPGAIVWGKGMQEQHESNAKTEREIPQWDYSGIGKEYAEGKIKDNSEKIALGSDHGIAADVIKSTIESQLVLTVSVS